MNMVTFAPKQTLSSNKSETAPFPPYSTNKETSFQTLNLSDPTRVRIRTLTPILTNRTSTDDDEIGVFRAEKYFNAAIDDGDESETCSRFSSSAATRLSHHYPSGRSTTTSLNYLEQVRARIQPRTPSSVRSESSWNSRSVLLKDDGQRTVNPPTTPKSRARNVKKLLASFSCIICSDKHSVRTKEIGEISFRPSLNVETIQIQKPRKGDALLSFREAELFRQQCKSPEVYGSSPALKTMSLERRFTAMPWDRRTRNVEELVVAADSGSDASSDLFEIDSVTGKTGVFLSGGRRRGSDDLTVTTASGCVTPTTGYAPSEASIQWSVVTASAVDYASVLSDCDEAAYRRRSPAREVARRRRALLGCKSQRAVSVAGPGFEPGSIDFTADSQARFQAEIARIEQRMSHLASPSPRNSSRLLYIK